MIVASVYGRLGGNPVERQTRNGKPMVTASVAANVARPGDPEAVEWVNVAAFDRVADTLARHVQGDLIAVMGPMTRTSWTDREGRDRQSWNVTAESIVSVRAIRPGQKRRKSKEATGQPVKLPEGDCLLLT